MMKIMSSLHFCEMFYIWVIIVVFIGEYKYYTVYSGEHLCSIIPHCVRYWWIDTVKNIVYENNYPYENVTVNTPPYIFIDKTIATKKFMTTSIHNSNQEL